MMKKFLKIATICSLAFSLSTTNLVYATESDPEDPGSGVQEPVDTVEFTGGPEERDFDILAKFELVGKQRYAIDIFHSSDLTFHYQIGSSFDPVHFTTNTSNQNVVLPEGAAGTEAKTVDAGADGVWFGFDGVQNRISVFNRSNAAVKMTATSDKSDVQLNSTDVSATINLYLNGDDIENYVNRKLNVTSSKEISVGTDDDGVYQANELLYNPSLKKYTSNMNVLLRHSQAFSTVANDSEGGRFSANPEIAGQEADPVDQSTDSANNFVNIVGHSSELVEGETEHSVGYALVYFDISGKPFEVGAPYTGMKIYQDTSETPAPQIGSITLTFTAVDPAEELPNSGDSDPGTP